MKLTPRERWIVGEILDRKVFSDRRATRRWHRGPARDARYLAWVRTLPCEICGGLAEAAHTGADGGMRQKASDFTCIPLCHRCHRTGKQAYHAIGRRAFEALHMIDCAAVVMRLNAEYARMGRKAI